MTDSRNKLSQFWQELKHRNVTRVISVYAATAFVILELTDIVAPSLNLPPWTLKLVIIILSIGFIIAAVVSWIYDFHPLGGIVKTEPAKKRSKDDVPRFSNGWKIASYISFGVILLMAGVLLYPKLFNSDELRELRDEEGMISLAVLPFDNLTGDASLYFWQKGISEYLINKLGSSQELAVSTSQVVSDVLAGTKQANEASLSPDIARQTAIKIDATTYITGNFIGKENDASIMLNLVNTGNGKMIWSTSVSGDLGTDYRAVLDHLSDTVRNYMEIRALEDNVEMDLSNAYPNSAEAYRHYIDGLNAIVASNYEIAIESLLKAYEIDTTFTLAAFYLAFAQSFSGLSYDEHYEWTNRAYELKENLPPEYRPWIDLWYAGEIKHDIDDMRRYCDLLNETVLYNRFLFFDLGVTYQSYLKDYDKSIDAFKKVEELNQQWDDTWKYEDYYEEYSKSLIIAGEPEEALRICQMGLKINPDNKILLVTRAISYGMLGDSLASNRYMEDYWIKVKEKGWSEAQEMHNLGNIYLAAGDTLEAAAYFRRAYEIDPDRGFSLIWLIKCLHDTDTNIEESLVLSEQGLKKWPEDGRFQWGKGRSLYKLGRSEEALPILREAREIVSNPDLDKLIQEVENELARQDSL